MGAIRDIEHATLFLFSEGASYITGVTLVVDGMCNRRSHDSYIFLVTNASVGGNWMKPGHEAYPDMVLMPPQSKF